MLANWVRATTTTTGTGNLTTAAVSGYADPGAVLALGHRFPYHILDDSTGQPIESGIGYMSGATTLVRERILATLSGGTYSDVSPSAISLAAGTKRVILALEAGTGSPALPMVQQSYGSPIVLPEGLALTTGSGGTRTLVANTPVASCLRWPGALRISELVCQVWTAAGAGTDRIQVGIYAVKGDGLPGDLICRSGDILPNSTGQKTSALSGGSIRLPPGFYWFVIASNVAPVVNCYSAGAPAHGWVATPMGSMTGTNWGFRNGGLLCSALGGGWTALPATLTPSSILSLSSDFIPMIGAKVIS